MGQILNRDNQCCLPQNVILCSDIDIFAYNSTFVRNDCVNDMFFLSMNIDDVQNMNFATDMLKCTYRSGKARTDVIHLPHLCTYYGNTPTMVMYGLW